MFQSNLKPPLVEEVARSAGGVFRHLSENRISAAFKNKACIFLRNTV